MTKKQIVLPKDEPLRREVFIKIHDHESLSNYDRGRVIAAFARSNNLSGYPDSSKSKDGLICFVIAETKEDRDMRQRDLDRRIMEMVKVEIT